MIITIDGASGVGKTTAAALLSEKLGFQHLVGGVFFRSLTLICIRKRAFNEAEILPLARQLRPELVSQNGYTGIFLNGEELNGLLWEEDVNELVPSIANFTAVREIRMRWLRRFAIGKNIVADGRTLGTEIFPAAEIKFYLRCDLRQRAALANINKEHPKLSDGDLRKLEHRDDRDRASKIDKFRVAPDAKEIDTTLLSPIDTVQIMLGHISGNTARQQ